MPRFWDGFRYWSLFVIVAYAAPVIKMVFFHMSIGEGLFVGCFTYVLVAPLVMLFIWSYERHCYFKDLRTRERDLID